MNKKVLLTLAAVAAIAIGVVGMSAFEAHVINVIAKIEKFEALDNIEGIIDAADAVMVARGDLGIEIDYQRLPLVQTQLVKACQAEGKPVIIATVAKGGCT